MPFGDFREWICKLDQEGELLHIKDQVNLEPDIGASSQATILNNGPGLFFENLRGYPSSHTLSIGLMGSIRRLALSLDLAKSTGRGELVRELSRRLDQPLIKP